MAFENLFVRVRKSIGGIQLDAVLSESHRNRVRITKNPIELGTEITDHAVIEPKTLNMVVTVSDTPIGAAAFGAIVDLVTGLFGTSTSANLTRSNAAYNAMVLLQDSRQPLEIQTKLKLYQDMIITDLAATQEKDSSRIVEMALTLEEVIITETQLVAIPSSQLPEGTTNTQAASAEQSGRQQATTPDDTTNRSVIQSIRKWVSE